MWQTVYFWFNDPMPIVNKFWNLFNHNYFQKIFDRIYKP